MSERRTRTDFDNTKDSARVSNSSSSQTPQRSLRLRSNLLLAGQTEENKVGGVATVDDGESRLGVGSGGKEEEAKSLVVELDDTGRVQQTDQRTSSAKRWPAKAQLTLLSCNLPLPAPQRQRTAATALQRPRR